MKVDEKEQRKKGNESHKHELGRRSTHERATETVNLRYDCDVKGTEKEEEKKKKRESRYEDQTCERAPKTAAYQFEE